MWYVHVVVYISHASAWPSVRIFSLEEDGRKDLCSLRLILVISQQHKGPPRSTAADVIPFELYVDSPVATLLQTSA